MKKKLALLMTAAMMVMSIFGTVACAEEETEAASNILEGKTVGFAQTDSMSAWRTTETDSIKEYVEAAGGEFVVRDASGDIATQESNVRDLV